ncbi:ATP-grasp domain-containing protein [Actinoplanes oblitus]|uniref:ATP-grasp domain-containing protein n=1 Tax=Actinoplanes oblitus TaxID=3040509 RepID=A0ABY8WDH9_9ACTN|nr:ATP-grasp domain-containing protein [Actinoplanes oblitus]WIM94528.1 ATP-grasp domain-containing protein [Actinoplanes oblitus]
MRIDAFVQVGATRDGLDAYLDCARRRGLPAVLVETPAYLRWRRVLGRRPFDLEVGVTEPGDPEHVRAALAAQGLAPVLLLAGFERYAPSAFAAARSLGVAPWPAVGRDFAPLDKLGQRAALAGRAPEVRQPRHVRWNPVAGLPAAAAGLRFPQVVKPADGGGGLGVMFVRDARERDSALRSVLRTPNYDGSPFSAILVEEYVEGPEFSIQGIAHDGVGTVLTTCEKLTAHEPVGTDPGLRGFRELGHIGTHGAYADPAFVDLVSRCLAATGYREGPFHVDVIRSERGPEFVEMGFRLSGGGLVGLVERITGADWAEWTFRAHLGEGVPPLPAPRAMVVGQANLIDEREFMIAELLGSQNPDVRTVRATAPGDEVPAEDVPRLASDRQRHVGVGRVIVGGRLGDVRTALHRCLAGRLAA